MRYGSRSFDERNKSSSLQRSADQGPWRGLIVETDGWGNLDVDYVNCVNEIGERGIPVAGLNWSGTAGTFVVESPYLANVVDFNKNPEGIESNIVGENNYTEEDVKECIKKLKIAMLKKERGIK